MTAKQVIDKVNSIKPNQYSKQDKIDWLNEIERKVFNEIILTHENPENLKFVEITEDNLENINLAAQWGNEQLYILYLCSQIDFNNAEFDRYNNNMATFDSVFLSYSNIYHWKYKPLPLDRGVEYV